MDSKRLRKAYRALEEIARRDGTTVEEVIRDIEIGINETIDLAIRENNVAVLNKWKKIPCVGSQPTASELIACLGERLYDDMESNYLGTTFSS